MGRHKSIKPTGKFVVRKKDVNKAGIGVVYITYSVDGKTKAISTNVKVPFTQWDAQKQEVIGKNKDKDRLNGKLVFIKRGYDESIEQYDGVITFPILEKLLNGESVDGRPNPKKTDFIEYARVHNRRRYDKNRIGYSVYYNATLSIERFAKYIETIRGEAAIPIAELTIDTIEGFMDERRKKVCQATVNKDIVPLVKAIEIAEKNGIINPSAFGDLNELYDSEPRSYADKKEEGEEDVHYLTREQMQKFIEYYPKAKYNRTREFMDMFLFSFHACGLRVSDIATLEWKHIDFEKSRMEKVLVKAKNPHEIHLNKYAIAILNKWKKLNRNPRYVFNLLPADFELKDGDKATMEDEKRLKNKINSKNKIIQTSLNEIGKRIGLDFGLSMHVARHTFAIWALNERDISLHLVSRMLGHKSITATEKSYAKFLKDKIDDVVEKKATFDGCLPEL